jgi:hypothetical protein
MKRTLEQRFWSKVAKAGENDCWLWTASVQGASKSSRGGYGIFNAGHRTTLAHRIAYELLNGPIPQGRLVCHHCDTPLCCNPSHLFLGSHKDNSLDAVFKNRSRGPHLIGETNPRNVAPEKAIREYRELIENLSAQLYESEKQLAKKYKVRVQVFRNIRHGISWSWLKDT